MACLSAVSEDRVAIRAAHGALGTGWAGTRRSCLIPFVSLTARQGQAGHAREVVVDVQPHSLLVPV